MVIDSAKGDYFDAFYKKPAAAATVGEQGGDKEMSASASESLLNPLFDGSASWFTCVLLPMMLLL